MSVHWSQDIEWRHDRWDPMSNAPVSGYPILHVRGRTKHGTIVEPIHYAYGDGDGLMPPFCGWFKPNDDRKGFYEVTPVEWQPLTATYDKSWRPETPMVQYTEQLHLWTHEELTRLSRDYLVSHLQSSGVVPG